MDKNVSGPGIQGWLSLMQTMDKLYEEYARKNGLTYMSFFILETIYDQKSCTQKQISAITLYPKQTVNMVIRAFQEKGWVSLNPEAADRRSKRICLTEAGLALAREVVEPLWEAGTRAFDTLDPHQRQLLLGTTEAFVRAFTEKIQ